ncbi:hypothetical protein [Mycoplasma sp. ATU-Cv-508]|uniref:hypothetical protein n=1 Tax=Mycoplasma sp. ATU-Cv-508 TaxID=2048001 RepID=UPI000FDEA31A
MDKVLDVITIFTDEIFATLSTGVGVEISSELFFEVVVYVDKVLLASRISPKFVSEIRAISWQKLFDRLVKDNKLSISDRPIVENFTFALDENVRRGYYVQLGDFILARVNFESRSTILLYSHERLVRLNHDFQTYQDQQKQQIVAVSDDVVNMQQTLAKIAQEEADAKTRRKPSPQPDEGFRAKDDGRPRKSKRDSLKARRERRKLERKKMIQAEKTLEKTLEFDAKLMQHESTLPTTALDDEFSPQTEDKVVVKNPVSTKDDAPVVTKRWFAKKIRKSSGQSSKKSQKSSRHFEEDQLSLTNPTHLDNELPTVVPSQATTGSSQKTSSKRNKGKRPTSQTSRAKALKKSSTSSVKSQKAKKSVSSAKSKTDGSRRMKRGGAIGKGTD